MQIPNTIAYTTTKNKLPRPTLTPSTQVPFMEQSVRTARSSPARFSIVKWFLDILRIVMESDLCSIKKRYKNLQARPTLHNFLRQNRDPWSGTSPRPRTRYKSPGVSQPSRWSWGRRSCRLLGSWPPTIPNCHPFYFELVTNTTIISWSRQ